MVATKIVLIPRYPFTVEVAISVLVSTLWYPWKWDRDCGDHNIMTGEIIWSLKSAELYGLLCREFH